MALLVVTVVALAPMISFLIVIVKKLTMNKYLPFIGYLTPKKIYELRIVASIIKEN
jgi:hypothetical protein